MKKPFPYLVITVVFLLAFAPIASFVFALKNDFFLGYFPPKFLLSETLNSGQFPLWNPYISFGLPFYADMNGAYWNPITWIIALTSGYTAYTLTVELLVYVLLGGFGMYKLAQHFSNNIYICIVAALAYLGNGFVIGHLQHLNWISCSAFLPWCSWGIYHINKAATIRNYIYTALAFFFFITASHPGMIIGAIYFFIALVLFLLFQRYQSPQKGALLNGLKRYGFLLLFLCLISAGLITSYIDILPFFARNSKVDLALSLSENTTIQSWVSLLLPFGTVKDPSIFGNDIALRNNYFSLILAIFFLVSLITAKSKQQWFFLTTGMFFFILSLGGPFKLVAHSHLPLIGYVRVNGEFRIFAIICFIIVATESFHSFSQLQQKLQPKVKLLTIIFIIIFSVLVVYSAINILKGQTILTQLYLLNKEDWRNGIKILLDKLQFPDTILAQCVIQTLLLILLRKALLKKQYRKIVFLTAIDIVIATTLNMPFTGVGKVSVAKIDAIHQQSPAGIPIPSVQKLAQHDTISGYDSTLVGDWSFYNKQIGKATPVLYPVKIMSNYLFYDQLGKDSSISVAKLPFVFLTSSITEMKFEVMQQLTQSDILAFTTNNLKMKFASNKKGHLVYLQNYYPHWSYKNLSGNDVVSKAGPGFIAIPVQQGLNEIEINFNPTLIKFLCLLTIVLLFICVLLLLMPVSDRKLFL